MFHFLLTLKRFFMLRTKINTRAPVMSSSLIRGGRLWTRAAISRPASLNLLRCELQLSGEARAEDGDSTFLIVSLISDGC